MGFFSKSSTFILVIALFLPGCSRFLPEKERAPYGEDAAGGDPWGESEGQEDPGPPSGDDPGGGAEIPHDGEPGKAAAAEAVALDADAAAGHGLVGDGRDALPPDAASGDPEPQETAAPDAPPDVPAAVQKARPPAKQAPPAPRPEPRAVDQTEVVIRTVLGLIALLVLAYIAGLPRIRRYEEILGISQVITAGFPFVALGVIAALPAVGILTGPMLGKLTPFLEIGLGWVGLCTGYRFDLRRFDSMPRGTAFITSAVTSLSFVAIVIACGAVLLLLGHSWKDATFLRDAAAIGAAGALTSPAAARLLLAQGAPREAADLVRDVSLLDVIAGLLGLIFLGAFFRPQGSDIAWKVPSMAWIFITLGLGAAIGIVVYVVMRRPVKGSESIALLFGSVAFMSGMAGFLFLSPIVVCFIAGVILANLPGDYKEGTGKVLEQLERPVYLIFLVVAGALWNFWDWRGWVLLPVFVLARLGGRWLGTIVIRRQRGARLDGGIGTSLVAAPLGELSIAIIVSVQALYRGPAIPWIVTAMIGGAVITEVIVQLAVRRRFTKSRPEVACRS